MIWMNDAQIELARHALGLDGRHKQSYRNYYALCLDSDGWAEWTQMCVDGNATTRPAPDCYASGMHYFYLTPEAAFSVVKRGEKLRPEELRLL